tara:strand:+ start:88 stop:318 length:231 start_codon:yes stop_codon:yes gene_type:complete
MKKIKLTEKTLNRIVERVIKEQDKENKMKELIDLQKQLAKNPNDKELLDKIAKLTTELGLPLTKDGADNINKVNKS